MLNILKTLFSAHTQAIDLTIRPMGNDKWSARVSLDTKSNDELKHYFEKEYNNADLYVDLKSALATPIVVVATPDDLFREVESKLASIIDNVVTAQNTLQTLDINTKLANATKAATSTSNTTQTTATTTQPKTATSSASDTTKPQASAAPIKPAPSGDTPMFDFDESDSL